MKLASRLLLLIGAGWFVMDVLSPEDYFDETIYALILSSLSEAIYKLNTVIKLLGGEDE